MVHTNKKVSMANKQKKKRYRKCIKYFPVWELYYINVSGMDLRGNRSELLPLQSEVLICLGRTCIDNFISVWWLWATGSHWKYWKLRYSWRTQTLNGGAHRENWCGVTISHVVIRERWQRVSFLPKVTKKSFKSFSKTWRHRAGNRLRLTKSQNKACSRSYLLSGQTKKRVMFLGGKYFAIEDGSKVKNIGRNWWSIMRELTVAVSQGFPRRSAVLLAGQQQINLLILVCPDFEERKVMKKVKQVNR